MCGILQFVARVLFLIGIGIFSFHQHSFAYVYRVVTYQNPKTGKLVAVLSDHHSLGTYQENIHQSQLFLDGFVHRMDQRGIFLDILNEDRFSYGVKDFSSRFKVNQKGKVSFQFQYASPFGAEYEMDLSFQDLKNSSKSDHTWLGTYLTYAMTEEKIKNHTVELISVDPRFYKFLWREAPHLASLRELIDLTKIENYLKNPDYHDLYFVNRAMKSEVQRYLYRLRVDRLKFLRTVFNQSQIQMQDLLSLDNQDLLQERKIQLKVLQDVAKFVFNDPDFLVSSVDLVSLFEAVLSQKKGHHTLVFLGGAHAYSIEKSFESLGYQKLWESRDPQDIQKHHSRMMEAYEKHYEGKMTDSDYAAMMSEMDHLISENLTMELTTEVDLSLLQLSNLMSQ